MIRYPPTRCPICSKKLQTIKFQTEQGRCCLSCGLIFRNNRANKKAFDSYGRAREDHDIASKGYEEAIIRIKYQRGLLEDVCGISVGSLADIEIAPSLKRRIDKVKPSRKKSRHSTIQYRQLASTITGIGLAMAIANNPLFVLPLASGLLILLIIESYFWGLRHSILGWLARLPYYRFRTQGVKYDA